MIFFVSSAISPTSYSFLPAAITQFSGAPQYHRPSRRFARLLDPDLLHAACGIKLGSFFPVLLFFFFFRFGQLEMGARVCRILELHGVAATAGEGKVGIPEGLETEASRVRQCRCIRAEEMRFILISTAVARTADVDDVLCSLFSPLSSLPFFLFSSRPLTLS